MFPLPLEVVISVQHDITTPACHSAQHTLVHVYTAFGTECNPIKCNLRFCSIFPRSADGANSIWRFQFYYWPSHLNCIKPPWTGTTTSFSCLICPKPYKQDLRIGPLISQHICSKSKSHWHVELKHSAFTWGGGNLNPPVDWFPKWLSNLSG